MNTNAVVHIKKGGARALKAGGAWVYDNEIDRIEGSFENGDMVMVCDFDGYCLGYGFINTRSKITVLSLIHIVRKNLLCVPQAREQDWPHDYHARRHEFLP